MNPHKFFRTLRSLSVAAALLPSLHAQPAPAPLPKLLVENALLFTMSPKQTKPFLGYMLIASDGQILTVAAGAPPATLQAQQVLDVHGHWIIPGFLSAHSHLWQAAFRGLAADSTLTGWLDAVYRDSGDKAQPEDFYWFTLAGALDHLQHGITAAYSFNYGGAAACSLATDVAHSCNGYAFQAEEDSGIRFAHGFDAGKATPEGVTPAYTAPHPTQSFSRLRAAAVHAQGQRPVPQHHDQRLRSLLEHRTSGLSR
jgi:5-methylthioadenosine/S-adenosylhomocysteine deaminase